MSSGEIDAQPAADEDYAHSDNIIAANDSPNLSMWIRVITQQAHYVQSNCLKCSAATIVAAFTYSVRLNAREIIIIISIFMEARAPTLHQIAAADCGSAQFVPPSIILLNQSGVHKMHILTGDRLTGYK